MSEKSNCNFAELITCVANIINSSDLSCAVSAVGDRCHAQPLI